LRYGVHFSASIKVAFPLPSLHPGWERLGRGKANLMEAEKCTPYRLACKELHTCTAASLHQLQLRKYGNIYCNYSVKCTSSVTKFELGRYPIQPRPSFCRDRPKGRILGQNPDKSLKSFPPCYSQSPLQLCLEISISSNKLMQPLKYFYSSVSVHCKGEFRKI
jgi:hypothetical protein